MEAVRVLFVDDEPAIAQTMGAILRHRGYEVTAVGTVGAALAQIATSRFDVLVSDLNIGFAGDGFTVVSAMRRTHPECITLILTGYPGFDSALEAIRSQVDDYLVKPVPPTTLIDLIEQQRGKQTVSRRPVSKELWQLLRENVAEITQRALGEMKADPQLGALPISDERRVKTVPSRLEELAKMLETDKEVRLTETYVRHGMERALDRFEQGYTIPLLATHVRLVERAIFNVIHENLASLNLSHFMFDLKRMHDSMGIQLEHTLVAFLEVQEQRCDPHKPGRDQTAG
jgi:YesN/AraC family two-component response regulator